MSASRNSKINYQTFKDGSSQLGIIDLLSELFKIRSKLWWLQKDAQTIEKIKLYGVQLEDDTIKNPTACEEMEHCRFFNSNILFEVMRSLTDPNTYAENKKMMWKQI